MRKSKSKPDGIGKAWLAAIHRACPRGVVRMPVDDEESYFARLYSRLRRSLARIKGAAILYEREWSGENVERQPAAGPSSFRGDDWEEDWAEAGSDTSFSYHLFFVGLEDPAMQIDCETESVEDDPGAPETIAGKEVLGFLVGVSLLAPVAMVQADCYARFEDGSASCPDFRPAWDETTDPMFGSGEKLTGFLGEATVQALERLNSSIVRALVAAKLMILDSELARARLPGFRAGEGAFVGQKLTGHSIRVQDAFFFAGM